MLTPLSGVFSEQHMLGSHGESAWQLLTSGSRISTVHVPSSVLSYHDMTQSLQTPSLYDLQHACLT